MQTLAQEVFRLKPEVVDMTMGELAYQGAMGSTDTSDNSVYRLWREGGDVLAWGEHLASSAVKLGGRGVWRASW